MRYAVLCVLFNSFANVIFATVGIAGTWMACVAMLTGGLILLTILLVQGHGKACVKALQTKRIWFVGLFAAIITASLGTASIWAGVAPVAFLSMLSPAFATLFILLRIVHDKLTWHDGVAVTLCFLAAGAIALDKPTSVIGDMFIIGCVMALIGAAMIAANYFLLRSYTSDDQPLLVAPALFLLIGGAALLPFQQAALSTHQALLLVSCGIGFALANVCLVAGIKRIKPQHAVLSAPIGAAFGALWGFLFLDQALGINTLVGFGLGILSIAVAQKAVMKPEPDFADLTLYDD